MKVRKYNVNNFDTPDFSSSIELEFLEFFGETKISCQFLTFDDSNIFYVIGTEEEHQFIVNTINKFAIHYNWLSSEMPEIYGEIDFTKCIEENIDVTDDVFNNPDFFVNLQNCMVIDEQAYTRNNIKAFYDMNISKDMILEKIFENGVESLNEYEKQILQA